ncbi:MAG TPA: ribose-5-phosphate isomerase RpiA [Thermoplasmata archaeon]|nr:ribose-5-phosphate isomerase RpiA [Thermoplasmata archaeon]
MADELEAAKAAAARHAVAKYVRPAQRLALGTGSTAQHAVRAIAALHPKTPFECVASSLATEELAQSLGLAVRPLRPGDRFDLMLDGADEVTPDLALTKGGGGALLREKLLAHLSRRLVILVDPTKLVDGLGTRSPIPVEIVPFARPVLAPELAEGGYAVALREWQPGQPVLTDNGNEILDLRPARPIADPAAAARRLRAHVGVVETGIFVRMAHRVVIGHPDGRVEERSRSRARPAGGTAPGASAF